MDSRERSETMSFFVDAVPEDSFYENLTLGVVKILDNLPCVKNVRVDRRNGCERNAIANWEQRHGCVLPEDVKNFYASIDGFLLQWNLEIAGEEFPVGRMEIGKLSSLKRYLGVGKDRQQQSVSVTTTTTTTTTSMTSLVSNERGTDNEPEVEIFVGSTENVVPGTSKITTTNPRGSKLFEIVRCFPTTIEAKVYLAYPSKVEQKSPEIWLHQETTDRWYHLADSFTKYFRMMLVHLGLPVWQCCVVGLPLPTWVEQVYFLVGPHLLPNIVEPTETISTNLWNNGPTNLLDPSIFRNMENKLRNSRKK
ncbi:PREDICTED: tubulin polyglutamylase complex subunit 2 [Polistes dominula]|uniref:Tubulin polyglutamylase complex subunit 2 n=1 Tax=Polistes dominula TaxID=743375 RepID=A0ABM1IDD7_POLDO|nr:PREDICTED: tubulin polyglutamylase complex subunit 2 [Polistes dominula]